MVSRSRVWILCTVAFATGVVWGDSPRSNFADVRTLLAARCYRCHGPAKQEAGLRLDRPARPLVGQPSSAKKATVLQAEILRRVQSADEDLRMPPQGARLSSSELTRLKKWVAAGMPGPVSETDRHWAFEPIRRPPLPASGSRFSHPVDRLLAVEWERSGLEPSPPASRRTLIRRLYLDLVGRLPAWARVQRFQHDRSVDAYERLVDELLSSPHFGERWGRHWLDLARYADSTGYESDKPRQMWMYRDWVIQAMNSDLSFDRFVSQQLAGDLLPNATTDQQVATGFHCSAMIDPGVRWESVMDRVSTTGTAFLGLTLGCAQCHSHKTDPITHADFYRLYAYFNNASIEKLSVGDQSTLVMKERPQPTRIFTNGEPSLLGPAVTADVPVFFRYANGRSPKRPNRVHLAKWLVDRRHPLTARVMVNRLWQHLFGVGFVATNDFGRQTAPPRQLALLDYLASELQENWSRKELLRLIVTSRAYRQQATSRGTPSPPELFARQSRFRLEAEIIRDVTLDAAGSLTAKIGGPSVFPPQPPGILNNRATPATWVESKGEDRWRRGMYTWFWRLTPHPHSPLFDAPDAVTACARRTRSNVPVQALTLLNDPVFFECARRLASHLITVDGTDERLRLLFRRCLSRDPSSAELSRLRPYVEERLAEMRHDSKAAERIAGKRSAHMSEQAAWTLVCRVILNLDEFITRE